ITEYLVNISKRRAFWSLNEDILKICYSEDQYAISIKEDTAYPCLHSPKTTKETSSIRQIVGIKSLLNAASITAALIDVNAAQSKLVLMENLNENHSKCLRLLLKEFNLLKWDQQVVSELVALRNFARRYGSRFCTRGDYYALWKVIENGATLPKTQVVEGVTIVMPITTGEDKAHRRLEVKARTTKKTQRNLLKQQYKNFTAPSSEMLDQTFDRLQKLMSQLDLLNEKLSQEDVNQKLLRSLSPE
ncbi:hypothetical protein Tco_1546852, partial [Tanacetum coccineum]